MRKNAPLRWQITELFPSLLVLFILFFFTYGILFKAPYSGFDFGTGDGRVMGIFVPQEQEPVLQEGDILIKVGNIRWENYKKDARLHFFENNKAGDIVDIVVSRDGTEVTVPWKFPGFNQEEFSGRFFNIWGLSFIFWFFGAVVQLSIRPKDERWWLFVSANYLTALWLIFGSSSSLRLWGGSLLLHAFTWLLLPVYLHLHWIFPHPFKELSKTTWAIFYAVCIFLAITEVVQFLPRNFYILAFLTALIGSFALEVAHFVKQADQRREVRLLAVSLSVAFLPAIGLGIFAANGPIPNAAPIALFALPFMPLAYFYVIYRRQLGGLEVRVNRLVSLYGFMILLMTFMTVVFIPLTKLDARPETWIFIGILLVLFTTIVGVVGFPVFQKFVEKRLFGIKLPYQNLQETYSSRITTSTSLPSLLQLLEDEVFPTLLVRQYAFMEVLNRELKILLAKNINVEQLADKCRLDTLIAQAGTFFPDDSPCGWVRLILPLKVGDRFIGFWILGRRDPDDYYPQAEISILQSLANQTAIALSNIQHAEQLRRMYQTDIERNEKERMRLALDLHDSVLNELAVLRTNLDEASLSPQQQTSYEVVIRRLREIVSELRPPMLMYGFVPAVNALADNLMERSEDKVTVNVDIKEDGERLPQNIEEHLFRIVQEACQNSLRHAQAKHIGISGNLARHKMDLNITDDGMGFEPQGELGRLIANQHFGLAGMLERAHLIGAEININSILNHGTDIHIAWVDGAGQI